MRAVSLQHDWIVHADVDEHQEYPDNIVSYLDDCSSRGINTVIGELRDRVSK